jgi:hypothetical protein
MKLDEGWNQIHFNLTDFTRRAYGTNYLETLRYKYSYFQLEFKFMLIVELEEFTLRINFYLTKKFQTSIKHFQLMMMKWEWKKK